MLLITLTALIIVLVSLARDIAAKDLERNDGDSGILREILQRIDQMERNNNKRFDQIESMERNNNKRFDQMETQMNLIQSQMNKIQSDVNDNKNLSIVMETIVEQQMVITAEIFTVSQTLPFCCCQYQNTTDLPETKTTTIDTGKPETTTPTTLTSLPTYCAETMGPDGIYQINVTNSNIGPFDVYCMNKVAEALNDEIISGAWLVIQRRQDKTTSFYQNWTMYQRGFGDLNGSFWIGLDKLYALTKSTEHELWIQLEDKSGKTAWAKYKHFAIGSESENYKLNIGHYVGNAGDSLEFHKNNMWSTFDKDNDKSPHGNYAMEYKGAWWFHVGRTSHLNGVYGVNNSIYWLTFPGHWRSITYAHMAIRPRK